MRENLTAKRSFTYQGRALTAGAAFTATRADARVLRALGRAAPADTYQTTQAAVDVTKAPAPAAGGEKASAAPAPRAAKKAAKQAPKKADPK